MSSYTHTDDSGDTLQFAGGDHGVLVESDPYVSIPNADVPTVAAELLKAAGHHYLAGYIEGGIDVQERAEKAEAEAAEKKLQERRNALAKKYHGLDFVHIGEGGQRVINDIIELQDKLDGASRD